MYRNKSINKQNNSYFAKKNSLYMPVFKAPNFNVNSVHNNEFNHINSKKKKIVNKNKLRKNIYKKKDILKSSINKKLTFNTRIYNENRVNKRFNRLGNNKYNKKKKKTTFLLKEKKIFEYNYTRHTSVRMSSINKQMIIRQRKDRVQICILEDGILTEHFISKTYKDSIIGNIYLGKVKNVLPSMEAAFIDIGKARNAVMYASEFNWELQNSYLNSKKKKIEFVLNPEKEIVVQVIKESFGNKGARLTNQISLSGKYLIYTPKSSIIEMSKKLSLSEKIRLKKIIKHIVPKNTGLIVRTAAHGLTKDDLFNDIENLQITWQNIENKIHFSNLINNAPRLLYSEPNLMIKVVRDIFNETFDKLTISGEEAWHEIQSYISNVAPDLLKRIIQCDNVEDLFVKHNIDYQLRKALNRKVYLPSGGSLIIDKTEAMTVIDVNTGKYIGNGGNLEQTVTKNNLEAAEEVIRQLRLRDIGGIIVIDFIDMILESNRTRVLNKLIKCLERDRTRHQVAEVTSLGLVQMTRKRMGIGLLETFSKECDKCYGKGFLMQNNIFKFQKYYSCKKNISKKNKKKSIFDQEFIKINNFQITQKEINIQNKLKAEKTKKALQNIAFASMNKNNVNYNTLNIKVSNALHINKNNKNINIFEKKNNFLKYSFKYIFNESIFLKNNILFYKHNNLLRHYCFCRFCLKNLNFNQNYGIQKIIYESFCKKKKYLFLNENCCILCNNFIL